jgi:thioredoxin reductase
MTELSADVLVVGAGPAGLAASLALGRALKSVVMCDAGQRRNAAADYMHGFVTRDGVSPVEFRRIARQQLQPYAVTHLDVGVARIDPIDAGFAVTLADAATVRCKRVLLTTGMVDLLPDLPNLNMLWGHSIFGCPYCHGWEFHGQRWGFWMNGTTTLEFAQLLVGWTSRLTIFAQAGALASEERRLLEHAGATIREGTIRALCASPERKLTGAQLDDGTVVELDALVMRPPQRQVTLVQSLGVELDAAGFVRVDEHGQTSLPGIFAAGDLAGPMHAATFAAAAGTRAAYRINHELTVLQAMNR